MPLRTAADSSWLLLTAGGRERAGAVAAGWNETTGELVVTLPQHISLEALQRHRIEFGVLNGLSLQPAPRIDVRTYNASGPFCGDNVTLTYCTSRNETLHFVSLETATAAGEEWQDGGEAALMIRIFRLATASQTNSIPLAQSTIHVTLRPWIDLDHVNTITLSGLVGITSLDKSSGLTETWSSAPPSSPPAPGEVVEYRRGVSLPASHSCVGLMCRPHGQRVVQRGDDDETRRPGTTRTAGGHCKQTAGGHCKQTAGGHCKKT
jgi:hypothetical protein